MNREEKSITKFNALIPEISVKNIEKSKEFYISILGFKLEYERVLIQDPNGYLIRFQKDITS